MRQICRTEVIITRFKIAWSSIDSKILNNLVKGMHKRIAQIIETMVIILTIKPRLMCICLYIYIHRVACKFCPKLY